MKAKKAVIKFGEIDLEVYQLPNGDYTLGQTQVGKSIGKGHTSVIQFLSTTSPFATPHKEFLDERSSEIIVQDEAFSFDLKVKPIPIKITMAYWTYWAIKGNTKAQALLAAGTEETLTRLADKAFGVAKSEEQYQIQTNQSIDIYKQLLPIVQSIASQNALLINEMQVIKQELLILRPAYEELQTLNKSFDELNNLKVLLEDIAKVIDKPNQEKASVREWLKKLNLDSAVSGNQCRAIGRRITEWLKVGKMEQYGNEKKYPESLVPLIKLATKYQLFHAK